MLSIGGEYFSNIFFPKSFRSHCTEDCLFYNDKTWITWASSAVIISDSVPIESASALMPGQKILFPVSGKTSENMLLMSYILYILAHFFFYFLILAPLPFYLGGTSWRL